MKDTLFKNGNDKLAFSSTYLAVYHVGIAYDITQWSHSTNLALLNEKPIMSRIDYIKY